MSIIFYTINNLIFFFLIPTVHAIIKLNEDKSLYNKQSVSPVFFDTVDHNKLLNKISHYGINDTANNQFPSYFANRNQFAASNGYYSVLRTVSTIVSMTLFFLLYINDLHNALKLSSLFQYPVNICIVSKQNSVDKINKNLKKHLIKNERKTLFLTECKQNSFKCNKNPFFFLKIKIKTNISIII